MGPTWLSLVGRFAPPCRPIWFCCCGGSSTLPYKGVPQMPITQLNTRWQPTELFTQSLMTLSDDTNWMVQSQTDYSLILRRDPSFGVGRWLTLIGYGFFVVFTLGIGLLLMPLLGFLFVGRSPQQITINTRPADNDCTLATFNYTKGATTAVRSIISIAPGP